MDPERAERHLRLVAEASLREVLTLPRYDVLPAPPGTRESLQRAIARIHAVATALSTVGALDTQRAANVIESYELALAVRHRLPV